jgi:Transposase IS66 family
VRGPGPDGDRSRQSVRDTKSRPLIAAMKVWLETQLTHIPPRSGLADAIRYAVTRWSNLCCFLDDGRIELDTNNYKRPGTRESDLRTLIWPRRFDAQVQLANHADFHR